MSFQAPPIPFVGVYPSPQFTAGLINYISSLSAYLQSFTYKTTPGLEHTPDIQAIKQKPFHSVCSIAKDIQERKQPIKCLEAVVVAAFLTKELAHSISLPVCHSSLPHDSPLFPPLVRIPLRFRTYCAGHFYWHILLLLVHQSIPESSLTKISKPSRASAPSPGPSSSPLFFAIVSISRQPSLAYRPLSCTSFSSLLNSFQDAYAALGHTIVAVTLGLPLPDNANFKQPIITQKLKKSRIDDGWEFVQAQLTTNMERVKKDERERGGAKQNDTEIHTEEEMLEGEEYEENDDAAPTQTQPLLLSPEEMISSSLEWRDFCSLSSRYLRQCQSYYLWWHANSALILPPAPLHSQANLDLAKRVLTFKLSKPRSPNSKNESIEQGPKNKKKDVLGKGKNFVSQDTEKKRSDGICCRSIGQLTIRSKHAV